MSEPRNSTDRRLWAARALLVAAPLLAYGNTLWNGFAWDDEHIIVLNPETRDVPGMDAILFSPDVVRPYYRPLNRASYLLDFRLFGMRPAGFHAVNVIIHSINVLLLFGLARMLFPRDLPAFVAALIFAVHPVNAESVDFITARNNLLALCFVLASLIEFWRGRQTGAWWRFAVSAAFFFLGLLSKETAVMVLALLAAPFPRRIAPHTWAKRLAWLTPHAAALAVYAALRWTALGGALGTELDMSGLTSRLAESTRIVAGYVRLVLVPVGLTVFHPVESGLRFWPGAWVVACWTGIGVAAWTIVRKGSDAARFALAWLAVNLLPVANIVPIPSATMAERYLYVPAVGIWLVIGALADRPSAKRAGPRTMLVAVGVLSVALGALTVRRNADWRNDVALFSSAIRVDPLSTEGHFNLGNAYLDRGRLPDAEAEWQAVLRIDPAHSGALTQLGTLAAQDGNLELAERRFRAAVASRPDNAMAHFNLARICEMTARSEQAVVHYRRVLENAGPEYAEYVRVAERRIDALRSPSGGAAGP